MAYMAYYIALGIMVYSIYYILVYSILEYRLVTLVYLNPSTTLNSLYYCVV